MREIVLDTETTGLDPQSGDRIVEIGCLEIHNHMPTGKFFHEYINPEREMPASAFAIHGLSTEFLSDKPKFSDISGSFLEFIGKSQLIIHNADFDLRFLDSEMTLAGVELIDRSRALDTVSLARRRFPGAQVSLDALWRRFQIDLSSREKHGALLDAELLAEVYLYLMGGRQPGLNLNEDGNVKKSQTSESSEVIERKLRSHTPTAEEIEAHEELINSIKNPMWRLDQ